MADNTKESMALKAVGYTSEQFRERIKKFRTDAGYTQESMRDYIGGITVDCVRAWEQGRRVPKSRSIVSKMIALKIL